MNPPPTPKSSNPWLELQNLSLSILKTRENPNPTYDVHRRLATLAKFTLNKVIINSLNIYIYTQSINATKSTQEGILNCKFGTVKRYYYIYDLKNS